MFALSDVAREHSIDISDILAHLDDKTAMGRILDPSLEGRLELFFEELFAYVLVSHLHSRLFLTDSTGE